MNYRCGYLVILLIFILFQDLDAQHFMNYDNTVKYAEHLYKNRNYKQAALEFERVLVIEPRDTSSILKMAACYRLSHDYQTAKSRINAAFPGLVAEYPEKFAREYFKILFEDQEYRSACAFLHENKNLGAQDRCIYELGSLIMLTDWETARHFASTNFASNTASASFILLNEAVLHGEKLRYKKPAIAAVLSSVLPGSGKIYTGYYKDAVFSFLFISTSALLTWRAFQNNGFDVKSGFYGLLTCSFYLANIYGSSLSANKYNSVQNRTITDDVQRIILEN
jgi:hypothetical protein